MDLFLLARGARLCQGSGADVSSAEPQKGNIAADSTPSIRAGPKNHHFLLACESLINSRQKGLIRKLFGKWKGRGRDATAGASGWLCPSASPPRAVGWSPPWGPQICSSPPWGCRQSSPVDGFIYMQRFGGKISVYMEFFFF